jgi:hypothetical protein
VRADAQKERLTEFLMLRDGLLCFEGDADELRKSEDPYLKLVLS